MTKTKSTKRALLLSGLTLLVCVSMLIGSTFAWFTDSVTSSGNIIKSGKLEVEMFWKDAGTNVAQATYKDASEGAIFNYEKWEPGYVDAKHIKIENVGTLAFKYQVLIEATGTVSELANVIDVYFAEGELAISRGLTELTRVGTLNEVLSAMPANMSGDLLEGQNDVVTIALKMQESAGNEYQEMSIGSSFAVKLFATQLTSEKDSFDEQYDNGADYDGEISSAASLAAAAKNGGSYKVNDGFVLNEPVTIDNGASLVLDLNGNTISNNGNSALVVNDGELTINDTAAATTFSRRTVAGGEIVGQIEIEENGKLIVNGGTFTAKEDEKYVFLNVGELIINGGTINGGSSYPIYSFNDGHKLVINDVCINATFGCVNAYGNGSAVINGGTFNMTGVKGLTSHIAYFSSGTVATINGGSFNKIGDISMSATGGGGICVAGSANVTINGGEFAGDYADVYNWGNANASLKVTGGNFKFKPINVVEGYATTQNEDGSWTVAIPKASTNSELGDAFSNGGLIEVDGKFTVEDFNSGVKEEITVVGGTLSRDSAGGNPLTVYTTEKVTFEDVKFESVKGSAVLATRKDGSNIEVNNCIFENFGSPSTGNTGIQVYAKDVVMTFNGCTFKNMPVVTSSSYAGNVTLVFNDCTFSWVGANCPGMVQLENNVIADVSFNNCKYIYDALDSKSAKNFVDTPTSAPVGTKVSFDSFEIIGAGTVCKTWAVVSKGGYTTGTNLVVTATGTNSYTFNGEPVDFSEYLFK